MKNQFVALVLLVAVILTVGAAIVFHAPRQNPPIVRPLPPVTRDIQSEILTKQYVAALDVARVFGRSQGCENIDPQTISDVATEAIADELDPRVLAATMAVESSCDPLAVSNHGAIGRMQIMPRVWKEKFDFTKVNLFNPGENLHVGALILKGFIKQYGLQAGVRHYNGTGTASDAYDGTYVSKILALAGRKS
jgi:soluble lytic murein transglycosylase-like protein